MHTYAYIISRNIAISRLVNVVLYTLVYSIQGIKNKNLFMCLSCSAVLSILYSSLQMQERAYNFITNHFSRIYIYLVYGYPGSICFSKITWIIIYCLLLSILIHENMLLPICFCLSSMMLTCINFNVYKIYNFPSCILATNLKNISSCTLLV